MIAQINGIRLAFTDQGRGFPVVFVHAFPLSRAMWAPQIQALSGPWRLITVDLRGHGESDAPLWRYTLDQFAEDLHGLLDHLSIPQAVFVGLSMGGYTLFAFYRRYRDRVKALVLADTRAQADTEEGRTGRFTLAQTAYRKGASSVAEAMMPKMFSPATLNGRAKLIRHTQMMIEANEISGIAGALMAMAERPDSTPLLKDINVPTLIIVGDQDAPTPVADARTMADSIPDSRLVIIPEAGHLSNLEQPEAFNKALRGFLEDLEIKS